MTLDILLRKIYTRHEMIVLQWKYTHGGKESKSANFGYGIWVKLGVWRSKAPREGFPGKSAL